ncbi:hypothetical protein HYDPIDRAFT_44786 [Hydnomerulius pinastri MD-312]|uniref:Uncharacterized protein n=1 Tax=Hydnomerulius pinastri MD-312 TaxID=994086 RepID=A0A0C9W6I4_9AGAM|nr:hypothetical protein HYDPIDRAFT_44786 [Hydnomerulius pinastri MD-312]
MDSSAFSFYSNVFGFIAGGVSLAGLLITVCRSHLPSNKIKTLEALLEDTEKTFLKAVEDGLLKEPQFNQSVEKHLAELKEDTAVFRSRAYCVTNLRQDYMEFFKGLSTAIGFACQGVRELRAEVISTSERERRKLLAMQSYPVNGPVSQNQTNGGEHRPTEQPTPLLPHAAEVIKRPSSCPPALPAWKWKDLNDTAPTNPFADPVETVARSVSSSLPPSECVTTATSYLQLPPSEGAINPSNLLHASHNP